MKFNFIFVALVALSTSALANLIPEQPRRIIKSQIQPANPMANYNPTPVTEQELRSLWAMLTTKLKDKDCYRRAHIWSWDMFDYYGINSMKVFVHYTNKFNRELDEVAKMSRSGIKDKIDQRTYNLLKYNKTWDYHVAPLVQLNNGEYRVLDKSLVLAYDAQYPYSPDEAWALYKRPATIEEWTEGLMVRGELLWQARKAMLERDMQKEQAGSARHLRLMKKYRELGMHLSDTVDIKCHRAESIAEVDLNHDTKYCFYTIAPMFYYNEIDLRYLAFGETNQRYTQPVNIERSYNERNFTHGADNYTQARWNYSELIDAKKEFSWGASGDFKARIQKVRP